MTQLYIYIYVCVCVCVCVCVYVYMKYPIFFSIMAYYRKSLCYTVGSCCLSIEYFIYTDGSAINNLLAIAGDVGLIPGLERALKKEMATHSSILTWEISWTVHGVAKSLPQFSDQTTTATELLTPHS